MKNGTNPHSPNRPATTHQVVQFQSRLLQGLSFSTNSWKTWKNQIHSFLSDASGVIDAIFLFAFFPNENEKFSSGTWWE